MSRANFMYHKKSAASLQAQVVSGDSATTIDLAEPRAYTVKVSDITAALTLTLPDGTYEGQEVLIYCTGNDNTKNCTLSVTSHVSGDNVTTIIDAENEFYKLVWLDTAWGTIAYGGCSALS